eukprot:COSAG02_NODE_173_length_31245_cov_413.548096_25_plen_81_part_00
MRSRDQMSFPANASICTIVLILRRRRPSILILKKIQDEDVSVSLVALFGVSLPSLTILHLSAPGAWCALEEGEMDLGWIE